MSRTGKYFDDLEQRLGQGTVTSGYRTQAEQDALRRRGATRAQKSAHTYNDGYDFKASVARTPEEFAAHLKEAGYTATRFKREGGGPNDGTGPHWHAEGVRPIGGKEPATQASTQSKGGGMPQDFLAGLESKLGPQAAASGNVTSSAADPSAVFGVDKEMNSRQAQVESNIKAQGQAIEVLDTASQALQAVQVKAMENQVADTKAISNEIQTGVEQVKQKVKPIFEARQRVADQLTKIATMNPLERGLRGIFDLNYDQKYLKAQADRLEEAAAISTQDFDTLDKLNQVALREVSRRYGLETAIPELAQEQANADLGLVGLTLTHANAALDSLKTGMGNQVALIQSKNALRQDIISRLDAPTLIAKANEARANNGIISIGGVELSYNELFEAGQNRENQDLQAESIRMSIANNRMDMADKQTANFARTLTRPQLEEAIRNGGVYRGIQIPQDILTNLYNTANQQAAAYAEQQSIAIPSHVIAKSAADITGYAVKTYDRLKGALGPKAVEKLGPQLGQLAAITKNIAEAVKAGTMSREEGQLQLAQLGKVSQDYEKQVDSAILNSVGGDQRAAGYVKSFMQGAPLGQGTATEALTYFAIKGGLPDGMAASAASRQVFKAARAEALRLRTANPKISKQELEAGVQSVIESAAQDSIGDQRFEQANANLPAIAKASGLHFGKLGTKEWQGVVRTARNDALVAAASAAQVTPQTYSEILKKGAPLEDTPDAKAEYNRVVKATGIFNSVEQRQILEGLDELPQIAAGRRNSSLYRDTLQHPSVIQYGKAVGEAANSSAFGDYLVSPMGNGGFENRLDAIAQLAGAAQDMMTHDVRQAGRKRAQMYQNNPVMRTGVILSTIPGVGKSGAQALTPFISAIVKDKPDVFSVRAPSKPDAYRGIGANELFQRQDDVIFAALNATKFQDPNLEAYRKTAIKGWRQSATQEMTFMEQFLSVTGNASGDAGNEALRIINPILAPIAAAASQ